MNGKSLHPCKMMNGKCLHPCQMMNGKCLHPKNVGIWSHWKTSFGDLITQGSKSIIFEVITLICIVLVK